MGECSSDWVVGVISDHVLIPKDLPTGESKLAHSLLRCLKSCLCPLAASCAPCAGEYVLGWRWDAEETAQIWYVRLFFYVFD